MQIQQSFFPSVNEYAPQIPLSEIAKIFMAYEKWVVERKQSNFQLVFPKDSTTQKLSATIIDFSMSFNWNSPNIIRADETLTRASSTPASNVTPVEVPLFYRIGNSFDKRIYEFLIKQKEPQALPNIKLHMGATLTAIRYSLKRLVRNGVVQEHVNNDIKAMFYSIRTEAETEAQ